MAFNPRTEYQIIPTTIKVRHFHSYRTRYVTRPPYQRKSVWGPKKKQNLLDSLIRRYYIPKLVIREVRLSDEETVNEVIDGQQRINTVQDFFENKIKLPRSLEDISKELANKYFKDLKDEHKEFIEEELSYSVDKIVGIEDPKNNYHQKIATEIFWRLQQGESLNFMEVAHAKLASLSRNFVVKYSDDISFNFDRYVPLDENKYKHNFFTLYDRDNNRMQHLMLMSRLTMIEEADGYAELKDTALTEFIEKHEDKEGIGNDSFEDTTAAKNVIKNLDFLYNLFKDDTMQDEQNGIKELKREYLIISIYMLVRHLKKHYVVDEQIEQAIKPFYFKFHERWQENNPEDTAMVIFINNRQQSLLNIQMRDMVMRELFFEYCKENNIEIKTKDEQRAFNEAQRIKIYRRDNGLCKLCLKAGKSKKDATVSWSEYQADHVVPHTKGGATDVENAQVLCKLHNQRKGAKMEMNS